MRRFVLAAVLAAFQLAWLAPVASANTDDRDGLAPPVSVQLARALAENDRLTQQLAAVAAERDDAKARLQSVTDERDRLKEQLDARATDSGGGGVARPFPFGGGMGPYDWSRFTWGNCTAYVASWRPVPWNGDAIQWWPNAAAMGYPEGQAPVVGAIMVTRESGYGHVALVKAVSGASWTVVEMNVVGLGVIDTRTISPGQVPLVGFIYQ